jgi:hypothetical protein
VGAREWYVNMNNPMNDSMFSIESDQSIAKECDGSWSITNPEVLDYGGVNQPNKLNCKPMNNDSKCV